MSTYSSREVKFGALIAVVSAACVALAIVFGTGRLSSFWRRRENLYVLFENAGGLTTDAPVRYNGIEIGHVKWMRVLHLDEDHLEKLPPLTKRDMDNLPLRPALVVHNLRDVADVDFDTRCRTELLNRTMIELCLEVAQEGEFKHFRQDDQFRIVSTVFGDTAVEIISGNGPLVTAPANRLMLGTSGDFFSNLAKSMGDVKVILSNVTDVVGTEERKSFTSAQGRFGNIQDTLQKIANTTTTRTEQTLKKFDTLQEDSTKEFADVQKVLDDLQPKVTQTFDGIGTRAADIRDRVQSARDTADKAITEISEDAAKLRTDVRQIIDRCKPNYDAMRANIRKIYDRLGGLSMKLEDIRTVAGQAMEQSGEDIDRMKESFANSVFNFKVIQVVANENKDLMISNKDEGEYEYNTVVNCYKNVCVAVLRISQIRADVMEAHTAAVDGDRPAVAVEATLVTDKLGVIRDSVEKVRQSAEDKMLPAFERKKAAWVVDSP